MSFTYLAIDSFNVAIMLPISQIIKLRLKERGRDPSVVRWAGSDSPESRTHICTPSLSGFSEFVLLVPYCHFLLSPTP